MDKIIDKASDAQRHYQEFVNVLYNSPVGGSHLEIFNWLAGEFQALVPHEILLTTWLNELGPPQFDVISSLPHVRTCVAKDRDISSLTAELFGCWNEKNHACFPLIKPPGFTFNKQDYSSPIDKEFKKMRSALVYGIKDERNKCRSLYAAFSHRLTPSPSALKYFGLLAPHLDVALRRLQLFPPQPLPIETVYALKPSAEACVLTQREQEIMTWVRAGKTNEVIGVILNISPFTVKNHLKRIFQKLDVTNRAQAVDKL